MFSIGEFARHGPVSVRMLRHYDATGLLRPACVDPGTGERDAVPSGPPFWKYNVIDMASNLEVEAGVPVAQPLTGNGRVIAGALPAGRYVTLYHVGAPETLAGATASLLDWAAAKGLAFDVSPSPEGERWGCRLEIYLTDPRDEPDMSKWETRLAFRLAG